MSGRFYHGKIVHGQMFVEGLVAPAGWWESFATRSAYITPFRVEALLDTGATITCIPPQLAEYLMVRAEGSGRVRTADKISSKDLYKVDLRIFLPQPKGETDIMGDVPSVCFKRLKVMETYGEIDRIVLGMDIISQGKLLVEKQEFKLWL